MNALELMKKLYDNRCEESLKLINFIITDNGKETTHIIHKLVAEYYFQNWKVIELDCKENEGKIYVNYDNGIFDDIMTINGELFDDIINFFYCDKITINKYSFLELIKLAEFAKKNLINECGIYEKIENKIFTLIKKIKIKLIKGSIFKPNDLDFCNINNENNLVNFYNNDEKNIQAWWELNMSIGNKIDLIKIQNINREFLMKELEYIYTMTFMENCKKIDVYMKDTNIDNELIDLEKITEEILIQVREKYKYHRKIPYNNKNRNYDKFSSSDKNNLSLVKLNNYIDKVCVYQLAFLNIEYLNLDIKGLKKKYIKYNQYNLKYPCAVIKELCYNMSDINLILCNENKNESKTLKCNIAKNYFKNFNLEVVKMTDGKLNYLINNNLYDDNSKKLNTLINYNMFNDIIEYITNYTEIKTKYNFYELIRLGYFIKKNMLNSEELLCNVSEKINYMKNKINILNHEYYKKIISENNLDNKYLDNLAHNLNDNDLGQIKNLENLELIFKKNQMFMMNDDEYILNMIAIKKYYNLDNIKTKIDDYSRIDYVTYFTLAILNKKFMDINLDEAKKYLLQCNANNLAICYLAISEIIKWK